MHGLKPATVEERSEGLTGLSASGGSSPSSVHCQSVIVEGGFPGAEVWKWMGGREAIGALKLRAAVLWVLLETYILRPYPHLNASLSWNIISKPSFDSQPYSKSYTVRLLLKKKCFSKFILFTQNVSPKHLILDRHRDEAPPSTGNK